MHVQPDCEVGFKPRAKTTAEERGFIRNVAGIGAPSVSTLKDSGTRSQFDTGAVRDGQTGKGRMDLLPVRALMEVAKIFEAGALKYAARNWEKGIPLSRFMDSGLRHAMKWLRGDRDEPHLAQACWNFLCLLDTQKRIEEGGLPVTLNDLPCNVMPASVLDFPVNQPPLPQSVSETLPCSECSENGTRAMCTCEEYQAYIGSLKKGKQ